MSKPPVALVTGAAGDIGAATGSRLSEAGYEVVLGDLDERAVFEAAAALTASGARAAGIGLDVTDQTSVRHCMKRIRCEVGHLTALVNCAGVIRVDRFDAFSHEDWHRVFDVNVYGTYLCTIEAVPLLESGEGQGRVVNVASGAGKRSGPLIAPYASSKAAVISLTRSAAAALAPGIRVNCVCPGVIKGAMWTQIDTRLEEVGAPESARYPRRVADLPAGRAGSPVEVADAIVFLVSDASSYILGEGLNVDGGQGPR